MRLGDSNIGLANHGGQADMMSDRDERYWDAVYEYADLLRRTASLLDIAHHAANMGLAREALAQLSEGTVPEC